MYNSPNRLNRTYANPHVDAVLNTTLVWSVFLFFNFMITFRVLLASFVSEIQLMVEAAYEGFLVLYLVYRVVSKVLAGNLRLTSLEIYLLLMFLLPIIPAIGAWSTFGQPIFYGFAPFRDMYLIFGALVIFDLLRKNIIQIELVERVFVFTAWFCLLMYYGMSLLTNPKDFQDTGLAGANALKGEVVYYRFNMAFMFFGSIYYFVKSFYRRKPHYLIYAALFFIYIVFFRLDRTSMAVVIAGIAAFFVTGLNIRRQIIWLFGGVVIIFAGILVLVLFFPQEFEQYKIMFADAFVLMGVSAPPDGEESIRLYEMKVALEYIMKSPIIGNGEVSNEWVEGGYNHFLGFFYPSDIGIPGQIFIYGFLGGTILYGQFALALYYILRIKHIKRNVFLVSLKFFLLALGLDAFTNGYITIYAAQSITALVLIFHFYLEDRKIGYKLKSDRVFVQA